MGFVFTVFRRWKPGLGVVRLAFLCGAIGSIASTTHYWQRVWNWADCVFWPHAYYEKLAQTPGAFPYNGDHDRAALMLVRRGENRLPPEGFTKAYDLWGTPTQDQWARSNPADPNQKSETFIITEDDWGMPDFALLRTHPPGTEVYYAVLPKAYAYDVPYSSYLRFAALLAIPILGFLLPFALTISTAWVVDGFKTERRNQKLLERNVHLGIAARCGCIHGSYNPFHVTAQDRPLLIAENHKRDFSPFQVLLVTHVFVSGQ